MLLCDLNHPPTHPPMAYSSAFKPPSSHPPTHLPSHGHAFLSSSTTQAT